MSYVFFLIATLVLMVTFYLAYKLGGAKIENRIEREKSKDAETWDDISKRPHVDNPFGRMCGKE